MSCTRVSVGCVLMIAALVCGCRPVQWEYTITTHIIAADDPMPPRLDLQTLNELGADGWEAVACFYESRPYVIENRTRFVNVLLKRPKRAPKASTP